MALAGTLSGEIQALLKEDSIPSLRWGRLSDVRDALVTLYGADEPIEPLWLLSGKPTLQAGTLVDSLVNAGDEGLDPADYDARWLTRWLAESGKGSAEASSLALFDVTLSVAVSRYVTSLNQGRVDPRAAGFKLEVKSRKSLLAGRVRDLSKSGDPLRTLTRLEPKYPVYQSLKRALKQYRAWTREIPDTHFDFPRKFVPGMRHPDVPALRSRLEALGDLSGATRPSEGADLYDDSLETGVRAFQRRQGLEADGIIGRATQAQLSRPMSERVRQIELGLERLRWLPEAVSGRLLIVNIPSFKLYGSQSGDAVGDYNIEMNVIVGKAIDGRTTPVFHADMTMVSFRPYWNVPKSIAAKELIPEILRNPGYMNRENLEIVTGSGARVGVSEAALAGVEAGSLRLRQRPGADNALGLVKFSFPNLSSIYLHSTPSQGLFKRTRRDFSHGCIRVEEPDKLAEWVLSVNGDWPLERVHSFMNGTDNKTIRLDQPIPVYLFYSTVMADADGTARFYEDIYGHDQVLQELLAKGFPYP